MLSPKTSPLQLHAGAPPSQKSWRSGTFMVAGSWHHHCQLIELDTSDTSKRTTCARALAAALSHLPLLEKLILWSTERGNEDVCVPSLPRNTTSRNSPGLALAARAWAPLVLAPWQLLCSMYRA